MNAFVSHSTMKGYSGSLEDPKLLSISDDVLDSPCRPPSTSQDVKITFAGLSTTRTNFAPCEMMSAADPVAAASEEIGNAKNARISPLFQVVLHGAPSRGCKS